MCSSFALLKLRLVLTQPGRLSKVHVEFLHHCSDNPQLSSLSYTQTTRKFYQEKKIKVCIGEKEYISIF